MMIGVAQVIGINPTLRSFFSIGPPAAKISVAVLSGKNCDNAATAADAPSDCRNARRPLSAGNTARMTAEATTCSYRFSSLPTATHCNCAVASRSCSAWLRWRPQLHPLLSNDRIGSNGLSNVDMAAHPRWAGLAPAIHTRYLQSTCQKLCKNAQQSNEPIQPIFRPKSRRPDLKLPFSWANALIFGSLCRLLSQGSRFGERAKSCAPRGLNLPIRRAKNWPP